MRPRHLVEELLDRIPPGWSGDGDSQELLSDALRARLAADADAREVWARIVDHVRTLRSLPRVTPPQDLEGRIVAALNDGYRQDRAVALLRRLQYRDAPPELSARVRHLAERPFALPGLTAPSVLDRLVEVELESESRGLMNRLVVRTLRAGREPRWLTTTVLLVGILVCAWVAGRESSRVQARGTDRGWIDVVHQDLSQATPEVASLLDGLSGGAVGGAR